MSRFGSKEVADVTFYDLVTNKPVLFLDTLKMSNLENNAETSYIQGGKGNPRIMGFDYNRTASFVLQDALMNPKSLALQAGAEVKKGEVQAHKREKLVAVNGDSSNAEIKLSHTPVANSVFVFSVVEGYEDKEIEVIKTDKDVVQIATENNGKEVIVYYEFMTGDGSEQIIVSSNKYSGFYKVVGTTVIRNAFTQKDEAFEIVIPKAKVMSEWTLTLSADGDPAVFDMNLDVFKASENTDMVRLTRLDETSK